MIVLSIPVFLLSLAASACFGFFICAIVSSGKE